MEAGRSRDWTNLGVIAACIAPFLGFWATGLTDLDEGFYGSVVSAMLRTGDWITPTYNGAPWFEKPVLVYWLAAPSVALFGETFGPRLPSVLCTLATAWLIYRFSTRWFGRDAALLATIGYCGSLMAAPVGRLLVTDAPLACALTLAFTTFFDSLQGRPNLRLLTAFALGLAVLAKGPFPAVLFVLIASFTAWRCPALRPGFKGGWLVGTLIFFATVSAWYVPAYLANGEVFVRQFLIEQNLGRFGGGDVAHNVPWWSHPIYYPAVLLFASLPVVGWISRGAWRGGGAGDVRTFLWIWALAVLGLFTISGSKLPAYALPAVAPLMMLFADSAARKFGEARIRWLLVGAACWNLAVCATANVVLRIDYDNRLREVQELAVYARERPEPLAVYRMSRSDRDNQMKASLDETSHPSVFFYYNRTALMTDELSEILSRGAPQLLLTRRGRWEAEDDASARAAGLKAERLETPVAEVKWELYRLTPAD